MTEDEAEANAERAQAVVYRMLALAEEHAASAV
jgi:hypothetical protein